MYTFINELNKYSVGREQKIYEFKQQVYETKLNYLKHSKYDNIKDLFNPIRFYGPTLNDDKIDESAFDVSAIYPVNLEDEKVQIKKRADNINYLRYINEEYNNCRNFCNVSETALRNLQYLNSERQACVTDCLNVRTEVSNIKKPHSEKKTFVWLA